MLKLDLQTSTEILHKNMKNKNLRKHCYAVGKAMSAYYDYYKEQGRNTGSLTKEEWEIIGILHDSDWELTTETPEQHTLMLLEWLKEYDVPQEMLNVFRSHNNKITKLREPETLLEWTLECCDELTGFIVAVTLITPGKKISDVSVERVLKKFKQKEFARAVDRRQILQCEEKVNVPSKEFIEITLKAMQENAELLGF
jgi:predicted hydrolase (HD superfamily)